MKYACKHGFLNLDYLSSLHDHILMVMVLGHLPFDDYLYYYSQKVMS